MKWFLIFIFATFSFESSQCLPSIASPPIDFYEEAKLENFNDDELEILKPITDILQFQYNKLASSIDLISFQSQDENNDSESLRHLKDLLQTIQPELRFDDDNAYNSSLPQINRLKGVFARGLSAAEARDIHDIFQENINQSQEAIQSLIQHAEKTKASLIPINIIKIVKFVYKMMQKIYALGIRAGRTAYCTYSNVPAINATLQQGNNEIGSCYNYTETSIGRLRRDVKTAIVDIRANVNELVSIYRKLAKRQSLLGKLLTLALNIQKIIKDITETRSKAIETLDEVKTDGPVIAANIKQCATTSIPSFVQRLNETLTDLVTCVTFVDDSTQGPEPEPESEEESWEDQ